MCQPIHDFSGVGVPGKGKRDQPSPVFILMLASGPVSSVDDVEGPAPLLGPAPPFPTTAGRGTTTTWNLVRVSGFTAAACKASIGRAWAVAR
ncbi:unnamed protein product [Clonostachys solani]|uniref:Uncharacterized protein n=1 Tax=Clonostachys solani TaxID=160281 RepID=A0A9N9YWM5_9HYPO|nr:unnamed protein product [Clonostachys solani]